MKEHDHVANAIVFTNVPRLYIVASSARWEPKGVTELLQNRRTNPCHFPTNRYQNRVKFASNAIQIEIIDPRSRGDSAVLFLHRNSTRNRMQPRTTSPLSQRKGEEEDPPRHDRIFFERKSGMETRFPRGVLNDHRCDLHKRCR